MMCRSELWRRACALGEVAAAAPVELALQRLVEIPEDVHLHHVQVVRLGLLEPAAPHLRRPAGRVCRTHLRA